MNESCLHSISRKLFGLLACASAAGKPEEMEKRRICVAGELGTLEEKSEPPPVPPALSPSLKSPSSECARCSFNLASCVEKGVSAGEGSFACKEIGEFPVSGVGSLIVRLSGVPAMPALGDGGVEDAAEMDGEPAEELVVRNRSNENGDPRPDIGGVVPPTVVLVERDPPDGVEGWLLLMLVCECSK